MNGPTGIAGRLGMDAKAGESGRTLLTLFALVIGLPAVLFMYVTVFVVARQRSLHWYEATVVPLTSAAGLTISYFFLGLNPFVTNFRPEFLWLTHPVFSLQSLWDILILQLPLGLVVGTLCGCLALGVAEREVAGTEWHPLEIRRLAVEFDRSQRAITKLLASARRLDNTSSPALGVVVDGDLDSMQEGCFAVLSEAMASRSFQVSGRPGSGKTVTAERLVYLLSKRGRRVVYVDCKGTDPDLPVRLVAACIAARGPAVRVHHFPHEPLDGWVGTPAEIANRLIATQDTTEPYYASTLQTAVRTAMGAGASEAAGAPVRSSSDFMKRLDPAFLTRAYQGSEKQGVVADLVRDRQVLPGVKMRFAALFDAVGNGFDGTASYGDADLIFLSLPFASKADATAVVRLLLADFTHYCSDPSRKERRGDDVKMIIDEASALTHLSDQIIDLAERVRDVGGSVDVSNQSYEGSGDTDDQRRRLRGAMAGGTILHGLDDPEPYLETVGTDRKIERSWQLDSTLPSGMGSVRLGFRMKISPDDVRQADVGEAWVLSGGRFLRIRVVPNHFEKHHGLARQLLEESRQRGAALEQNQSGAVSGGSDAGGASAIPSWLAELQDGEEDDDDS